MVIAELIDQRDKIRRELSDKLCATVATVLGIAIFLLTLYLLPFRPEINTVVAIVLTILFLVIMYWVRHLLTLRHDIAKVNDHIQFFNHQSQSVTVVPN